MPRIQIAVEYRDGRKETVTVGRPADLIAFADQFRKIAPDVSGPDLMREAAWLVHRALRVEAPFDEWVDELENLEMPRTPAAEPELEREAVPGSPPDPTPAEPELEPDEQPTMVTAEWPFLREHRRIRTRTASSSPA
jgi:hypothetical protein